MALFPGTIPPSKVKVGTLTNAMQREAHDYSVQTEITGAQRFTFEAHWNKLTREEWAEIQAFLIQLSGRVETFEIMLPHESYSKGNLLTASTVRSDQAAGLKTIQTTTPKGNLLFSADKPWGSGQSWGANVRESSEVLTPRGGPCVEVECNGIIYGGVTFMTTPTTGGTGFFFGTAIAKRSGPQDKFVFSMKNNPRSQGAQIYFGWDEGIIGNNAVWGGASILSYSALEISEGWVQFMLFVDFSSDYIEGDQIIINCQGSPSSQQYAGVAFYVAEPFLSFSGDLSYNDPIIPGDFITFANHPKLYQVVDSDLNAETIELFPRLVADISTDEVISYNGVLATCRMDQDSISYALAHGGTRGLSLKFSEALI